MTAHDIEPTSLLLCGPSASINRSAKPALIISYQTAGCGYIWDLFVGRDHIVGFLNVLDSIRNGVGSLAGSKNCPQEDKPTLSWLAECVVIQPVSISVVGSEDEACRKLGKFMAVEFTAAKGEAAKRLYLTGAQARKFYEKLDEVRPGIDKLIQLRNLHPQVI